MASGRIQDDTGKTGRARRFRPAGAIVGAGLLSAGLLAGVPAVTFFAGGAAAEDVQRGSAFAPASFADLADKVRPAVVSVNVKSRSTVGDVSSRDFNFPDLPPRLSLFTTSSTSSSMASPSGGRCGRKAPAFLFHPMAMS